MRFKKIKKEIVQYFNKKIAGQELPIDIDTVYESVQVNKFPKRKTPWIKKPVPVFGIFLLIVFFGYIMLTTIFPPTPHTNGRKILEKIFSQVPQFQKVLQAQKSIDEGSVPGDDEHFRLEMTIKHVLFSIHMERYSNIDLADLFKRVLFHSPETKEKETMTFPEWEHSRILDLENRIKKMIEEKQVYRSLKRINKS